MNNFESFIALIVISIVAISFVSAIQQICKINTIPPIVDDIVKVPKEVRQLAIHDIVNFSRAFYGDYCIIRVNSMFEVKQISTGKILISTDDATEALNMFFYQSLESPKD